MSNSEIIEWLKKKAETVPMPGSRKMYQAAVRALEAQKDMVSLKTANVAICNACGKIDCDKMDKCEKLQLLPANCSEFPNNSDTINRQAAIGIVEFECGEWRGLASTIVKAIEQLPPVTPKQRTGKWIHHPEIGWGETWLCDQCGEKTTSTVMGNPRANFCPNCGADMRGEQDETD